MMLHFTLNACTFKRGKKIPSSLLDRRGVIANSFHWSSVKDLFPSPVNLFELSFSFFTQTIHL